MESQAVGASRVAGRRALLGVLVSDGERDGVPPAAVLVVALAPLVGGLALLATFAVHKPWLYLVLREDYPVEWAQFALCLFAGVVALLAAVRHARGGRLGVALLLLLAGLGALGLAGEEISWGQRVFALGEPAGLARVNQQDELNVHDTYVAGIAVDEIFELVEFLIGVSGVALSLLTRGHRPVLAGRLWRWLSPPLFTVPGFAAVVLYRPLLPLVPRVAANPVSIFQEWIEFCLYLALAATAACCYRRAAPGRSLADEPGGRWQRVAGDRSTPVLAGLAVAVLLLTVVFAIMTVHNGIAPGNVSGS